MHPIGTRLRRPWFWWPGILLLLNLALLASAGSDRPAPTNLYLRGYSVVPSPQKAIIETGDIQVDERWGYECPAGGGHIALRSLLRDLREFHALELKAAGAATAGSVVLAIKPGTVQPGGDPEIASQAYRIRIGPSRIEVTGNADAGLFYGVQTLLQLLKPGPQGKCALPLGTIEDWPAFRLRFLHWDTKHHQDRVETLKRYLDWSARFKVNMIGFELEDKFEYPSHPVIGAPGAFTTAELQEIVNYGLERFIQVVPQIQSPAHMAYVLKHPEFADLRADGNNYQICLCDERSNQLILSMYDDVIRATRGVEYFHVSTDEVYYPGICAKCDRPYNEENRSLHWIEFANRVHTFLKGRGRRMLAWVEYPVLARHIPLLPPDLINAVLQDDPEQVRAENERGIRQLIYTSIQGDELLFPDTLAIPGVSTTGRLESIRRAFRDGAGAGKPLGVYGAAWDDSGLHSETFWLGWATVAQYGWKPDFPPVDQHVAEFMSVYYGPRATGMTGIYRDLQVQARYFQRSWDRVASRVRGRAYGNSDAKGIGGERYDQTLPPPALPALPGLEFKPVYSGSYSGRAEEASAQATANDLLRQRLHENILRADRNRHNLEVFLSLAEFVAHHQRLIMGMKRIEDLSAEARAADGKGRTREALARLSNALGLARGLVEDRRAAYDYLRRVWEKSRFPKGQEVGGRKFLHIMDDTKDHVADRRPDLSYIIAPEESIGLEEWIRGMSGVIRKYATSRGLAVPQGASPAEVDAQGGAAR